MLMLPFSLQAARAPQILELVELVSVLDKRRDQVLEVVVSAELAAGADGSAALRTLFLVDSIVVLDARTTELVEAL